jgi:hypothetical protein
VAQLQHAKAMYTSCAQQCRLVQNDRFICNRGATNIENANLLEQLDTGGSVRGPMRPHFVYLHSS